MLHARKDYNRIQDPENKIPADEPVFLLRGQDKFAPHLLIKWAGYMRLNGGDLEMARMVEDHAQLMIEWQNTHSSKLPDLPKSSKVYSKDECIFQYCPHPELCEQEGKCMCQKAKK